MGGTRGRRRKREQVVKRDRIIHEGIKGLMHRIRAVAFWLQGFGLLGHAQPGLLISPQCLIARARKPGEGGCVSRSCKNLRHLSWAAKVQIDARSHAQDLREILEKLQLILDLALLPGHRVLQGRFGWHQLSSSLLSPNLLSPSNHLLRIDIKDGIGLDKLLHYPVAPMTHWLLRKSNALELDLILRHFRPDQTRSSTSVQVGFWLSHRNAAKKLSALEEGVEPLLGEPHSGTVAQLLNLPKERECLPESCPADAESSCDSSSSSKWGTDDEQVLAFVVRAVSDS